MEYEPEEIRIARHRERLRMANELAELRIAKELEELKMEYELEELQMAKELEEWKMEYELEELQMAKELEEWKMEYELEETERRTIPELPEQHTGFNEMIVAFVEGVNNLGACLKVFAIDTKDAMVYHVVDFVGPNEPGYKCSLQHIGCCARGSKIFIVGGKIDSGRVSILQDVWFCDISLPGLRTWHQCPKLQAPKSHPLVFVQDDKLYVLATDSGVEGFYYHTDVFVPKEPFFEVLNLSECQGVAGGWQELNPPPFLVDFFFRNFVECYAIDEKEKKIYIRILMNSYEKPSYLNVFDISRNMWAVYDWTYGYHVSRTWRGEEETQMQEEQMDEVKWEEKEEEEALDPLPFNLLRVPKWFKCAEIVHGKIFTVQSMYYSPKEAFEADLSLTEDELDDPRECVLIALIAHDLFTPIPDNPPLITDGLCRPYEGDIQLAWKVISGLPDYITSPDPEFLKEGIIMHLRDGTFCFVDFHRIDERDCALSISVCVFNLMEDDIREFPSGSNKLLIQGHQYKSFEFVPECTYDMHCCKM